MLFRSLQRLIRLCPLSPKVRHVYHPDPAYKSRLRAPQRPSRPSAPTGTHRGTGPPAPARPLRTRPDSGGTQPSTRGRSHRRGYECIPPPVLAKRTRIHSCAPDGADAARRPSPASTADHTAGNRSRHSARAMMKLNTLRFMR